MLTMILVAMAITAFLVLAYREIHRPRIKELPLTDEERAEIEAALAPYLETIKMRIDQAESTCVKCRYANRDLDKEPCRDCLRPGGRNRFESRAEQGDGINAYIDSIKARMY